MAGGTDPEGPLSQLSTPSGGSDGRSFLQGTESSISPRWKDSPGTQRSGRLLRADAHVQVPPSGAESQSWFSRGKLC